MSPDLSQPGCAGEGGVLRQFAPAQAASIRPKLPPRYVGRQPVINADNIVWSPADAAPAIVRGVHIAAAPGEVVAVVGPNGAGKSSLLRCLYRVHRPSAGHITVDGRDIWTFGVAEFARSVAVVLQEAPADLALTLYQVVAMGRTPHKGLFAADTAADTAIIDAALTRLDLAHLAGRDFATLSGGERQRAYIARALAQQPRIMILDEPTNHLDIHHQLQVMALLRQLGIAVIVALHDLNDAATACDRIVLMQAGSVVAQGRPSEVLTPERIATVFQVTARRDRHPWTGRPRLAFQLPPTDGTADL